MFDEMSSAVRHFLLPRPMSIPEPPIPPKRVSLVTIKIRYLIEQLVSVEVKVTGDPPHVHSEMLKSNIAELGDSTTLSSH